MHLLLIIVIVEQSIDSKIKIILLHSLMYGMIISNKIK